MTDDTTPTFPAASTPENPAAPAPPHDPAEGGETNAPQSASNPPHHPASPEAGTEPDHADAPAEDEDYLPVGQTELPVGDEVVVDDDTMRRALEAILMVTDEPLPVLTLARAVGRPTGDVAVALTTLSEEYTEQGRGFDLREVGGGWRYYTRAEAAPYVERFVLDGQQARLTQAALETLAVVAYKQPVSRARVSAIRGVNVDGVMRTLVARGLVEEAGSDTESQAILYRTTSYFLERMGMQSLEDLPELAPYLPEMDDIEEELAAQSIPTTTDSTPTTDPSTTPAAESPATEQSADDGVIRSGDAAGDDAPPVEPAEAQGDVETGIDGDVSAGGAADLDVAHGSGEVEPGEELGAPGESERAQSGGQTEDSTPGTGYAGPDGVDVDAETEGIDGELSTGELGRGGEAEDDGPGDGADDSRAGEEARDGR